MFLQSLVAERLHIIHSCRKHREYFIIITTLSWHDASVGPKESLPNSYFLWTRSCCQQLRDTLPFKEKYYQIISCPNILLNLYITPKCHFQIRNNHPFSQRCAVANVELSRISHWVMVVLNIMSSQIFRTTAIRLLLNVDKIRDLMLMPVGMSNYCFRKSNHWEVNRGPTSSNVFTRGGGKYLMETCTQFWEALQLIRPLKEIEGTCHLHCDLICYSDYVKSLKLIWQWYIMMM